MDAKSFIKAFDVLLLDMGDTFMFGCDRFNEADIEGFINTTYPAKAGKDYQKIILDVYNDMLQVGRDEKYYENFPTVFEFIKNKDLSKSEMEFIEELFANMELGTVSEKYINCSS